MTCAAHVVSFVLDIEIILQLSSLCGNTASSAFNYLTPFSKFRICPAYDVRRIWHMHAYAAHMSTHPTNNDRWVWTWYEEQPTKSKKRGIHLVGTCALQVFVNKIGLWASSGLKLNRAWGNGGRAIELTGELFPMGIFLFPMGFFFWKWGNGEVAPRERNLLFFQIKS